MPQLLDELHMTCSAQLLMNSVNGLVRAGPLERPVFSGSAVAVRPDTTQMEGAEPSFAKSALASVPNAVAGYDKVCHVLPRCFYCLVQQACNIAITMRNAV